MSEIKSKLMSEVKYLKDKDDANFKLMSEVNLICQRSNLKLMSEVK